VIFLILELTFEFDNITCFVSSMIRVHIAWSIVAASGVPEAQQLKDNPLGISIHA